MKIIAIVAASENNVIGIDNQMPWHLPNDFKHFKNATMGHIVLMGRNTWLSIGKPLPKRENWIISSQMKVEDEHVRTFTSIEEAIDTARESNADKLFIIGGGQIYKSTFDLIDTIIMTRVHVDLPHGDAHFPSIDPQVWTLVNSETHQKDEKHAYDYTFETWERQSL